VGRALEAVAGWQLGVSILSLIALVAIGIATVWIARQSGLAARRTVELAEASSMLDRLDRVERALEKMRGLFKLQMAAIPGLGEPERTYVPFMHERTQATGELQRSLVRVEQFRANLPLSVVLVSRPVDAWTVEELDEAIREVIWLTRKVADPRHPSQGII
jgi:hypothetical protein